MKRPVQHQIDDKACKQFAKCFPGHWVIRPQSHDYGIDFEIEIFRLGQDRSASSTGVIFKAQVKGTEEPDVKTDGFIHFQLELPRANYLCNEVIIPTLFILCDVVSDRVWWHAIQIDKDLKARIKLVEKSPQKSINVSIPKDNLLPNTLKDLVDVLADIELSNACNSFIELPQGNFNNLSIEDLSKTEQYLADKSFIAKSTHYWRNNDLESLVKVSNEALSNPNSSTGTKVSATLCIENVQERSVRNSQDMHNELSKIYFRTAFQIREISQNEIMAWRLYASIFWRAAQLNLIVHEDFGLYLSNKIHTSRNETGLDFFSKTILANASNQTIRKVFRKYGQCLRLISLALRLQEHWMIPNVMFRVASALMPFSIRLRNEPLKTTSELFRNNYVALLSIGIAIARSRREWDDMAQLVFIAFNTNENGNKEKCDETYTWAIGELDTIDDESRKVVWKKHLEELKTALVQVSQVRPNELDIPTDEEYQIYRQMARAMGINMDDPRDRLGQLMNIGLQDLNPERVLKDCKHLFVYTGHCGIPAQMLGLYTAGSKHLRCLKKNVSVEGFSLDKNYEWMKAQHCLKCPHNEPMPTDWKFSRSWYRNEAQRKIHTDYMDKMNGVP